LSPQILVYRISKTLTSFFSLFGNIPNGFECLVALAVLVGCQVISRSRKRRTFFRSESHANSPRAIAGKSPRGQSAANEFVIEDMQELFSRADDTDIFQLILVA